MVPVITDAPKTLA